MWKTYLYSNFLFVMLFTGSSASGQTIRFDNLITSDKFWDLVKNIAYWIQVIGIPLAVVAIIFTGFQFLTGVASGNTEGVNKAKRMFVWVIVGTAIVVGASVLVRAVENFWK